MPVASLAATTAQLIILIYGMRLVSQGQITIGILIGFFLFANKFYFPLRQMASGWGNFQQAIVAFDRIAGLLTLDPGMPQIPNDKHDPNAGAVCLDNVSFRYPDGKVALKRVNIQLERGKTYALFGPTGGGKTTAAALMARLYDPSEGEVLLDGRDIRSYSPQERARKIGFVLQEPILLSGTILENLFYGNELYANHSSEELHQALHHQGLGDLLKNLGQDLDFVIQVNGENLSLGQRQMIAFARAVLRRPEILILDEATANIDTVTEQLLLAILQKLPQATTKIIIAHRIKTIENADEIFFVNSGEITRAGSLRHAMEMLLRRA
jgi:ATP-binding cassette subfamily B protein